MDFFAAEERTRRRTRRLLALFVLAVAAMIGSAYLAVAFVMSQAGAGHHRYGIYYQDPGRSLWDPGLFAAVAAATLAVVGGASLFKWSEMRSGGSAVAEGMGARLVDPRSTDPAEHRLINVVEEMAIASGIPVPSAYVLHDEAGINAFAAGHAPGDAAVTVTRGALDKLTRDELQGVIGHEFSHILNGDMRMNMRLTAILFGILVIGLVGRTLTVGSRRVRQGGGAVVIGIGAALFIIGYAGYCIGRLIQAAVSRQREFLADASSVQFTRNPAGLSGALSKIGGYVLGSSIDAHRGVQFGHFFFAQAFQSGFGGFWATHPALKARIKAIDPAFDGTFFVPPTVVDVARQPWSSVIAASGRRPTTAAAAPVPPPISPPAPVAATEALIASAGTLTPEAAQGAQAFLAGLPARLRTAARSPHEAPVLLYGLLLSADPAVRARQKAAVAAQAGTDALHTLDEIEPLVAGLPAASRLPVLQLTLPALRSLPTGAIGPFAGLLDSLVALHGQVTPFDYALQKLLLRTLSAARAPGAAAPQTLSFQDAAPQISLVLSVLARTSSPDEGEEARAFAAGAASLPLLQGRLSLLPRETCSLEKLDAALEQLASGTGPLKRRLLTAACQVIGADGVLLPAELELVRAVAASLDVPLPYLGPGTEAPQE